jgi:hypothetical protein
MLELEQRLMDELKLAGEALIFLAQLEVYPLKVEVL